MGTPYSRAPHFEGVTAPGAQALNAALLIDFDNVTMGMRSDLAKELKSLLNSDIIKGKVTVQRAYADWRRYPQYIVPLSEASIDLIFAPAYGSSKKNATDIRMAIDGMELIFIRPEIGTYILLTGDSDFSSLVLKLKEYGKYVIGIGIEESSSDILVQNCDEYYSYTSIAGLKKTTDLDHAPLDPWQTVEQSIERMVTRKDVMRSDRLKQVMLEIDPSFDEKGYGFSKFSKFLAEASSRKLVRLKKLENGQYEVGPPGDAGGAKGDGRGRRGESRRGRKDLDARQGKRGEPTESTETEGTEEPTGDPLISAYGLLRQALEAFKANGKDVVRDSDVKRKMLALNRAFDETELGFPKFSRFLKQAGAQGVVSLNRQGTGNFEVAMGTAPLPSDDPAPSVPADPSESPADTAEAPSDTADPTSATSEPSELPSEAAKPTAGSERPSETAAPPVSSGGSRTVMARRGSGGRRRGSSDAPPALLEGQGVASGGSSSPGRAPTESSPLGLPSDTQAIVRYLSSRYKGVGHKTAETLVEALGEKVFEVLQQDPGRISTLIPANRAEQVLVAWRADYERRTATSEPAQGPPAEVETTAEAPTDADSAGSASRRRTRRGTRRGTRGRQSSD